MDKVHVIGRVFPSTVRTSIRSPTITLTSSTTGLQAGFSVAVQDSTINVECHLEKYGPGHFSDIVNGAYDYARTLVNLIGFTTGIGISVVFEYAILPDGELAPLMPVTPELAPLCTAYGLEPNRREDLLSIIQMSIADRDLYLSFNDLIDCLVTPHIALVNWTSGPFRRPIAHMMAPICRPVGDDRRIPKRR
jgi:hypothetical protein